MKHQPAMPSGLGRINMEKFEIVIDGSAQESVTISLDRYEDMKRQIREQQELLDSIIKIVPKHNEEELRVDIQTDVIEELVKRKISLEPRWEAEYDIKEIIPIVHCYGNVIGKKKGLDSENVEVDEEVLF